MTISSKRLGLLKITFQIFVIALTAIGVLTVSVFAFGVLAPPSFHEHAVEVASFLQREPAREYTTYTAHLLTILIIVLSLTGILVTAFGIALTLGLRAYFSSKAESFYKKTMKAVKKDIKRITDSTNKILDETEAELSNFDRIRLHESSASAAIQFSLQEWQITSGMSEKAPTDERLLYEEFKSLLRSYKLTEFADDRLSNAERELRAIELKQGSKLREAKRRSEDATQDFQLSAANNLLFFLSCLHEERFHSLLKEAQEEGKIPGGATARSKALSKLGLLEKTLQDSTMEIEARKRVLWTDSIVYAKLIFNFHNPKDLAEEATALIEGAEAAGFPDLAQRYQSKYASVISQNRR